MNIILFGASVSGKEAYSTISKLDGYDVVMFADNDRKKTGGTFMGLPVVSAEEAVFSGVRIVIASGRYDIISKQLDILGANYYLSVKELILDINGRNPYDECISDTEKDDKKYLLIAPAIEDSNKTSGFVMRRLENYLSNGLDMDVFLIGTTQSMSCSKNVNFYKGDYLDLEYFLKVKKYEKILIHFVDRKIVLHIERSKVKTPLIIWVHGWETESWMRRKFLYSKEEISETSALMDEEDRNKLSCLKNMYINKDHKFVFVSDYLRKVAEEDCNCTVANYEIIHNVIDEQVFNYSVKNKEHRKKVLVVKSFVSAKYANDIMVNTILELSKNSEFYDIDFTIYGTGELYDKVMEPLLLKDFPNVNAYNTFLTHEEIAKLHKENGIFISATRHDTQGVSMGEAMSSGLVVITNNVCAIPDFIDSSCGFLCENENYVQMAEAILFLYNNPDKFLQMSEAASKRVTKQCGINAVIPKEIRIITEDNMKVSQNTH